MSCHSSDKRMRVPPCESPRGSSCGLNVFQLSHNIHRNRSHPLLWWHTRWSSRQSPRCWWRQSCKWPIWVETFFLVSWLHFLVLISQSQWNVHCRHGRLPPPMSHSVPPASVFEPPPGTGPDAHGGSEPLPGRCSPGRHGFKTTFFLSKQNQRSKISLHKSKTKPKV